MPLGLKLWSTNTDLIPAAKRYFDQGVYDYLELYIVPDTFESTSASWKDLGIPFLLHAPHFAHGFNLSLPRHEERNRAYIEESRQFQSLLGGNPRIIVHGGTTGTLQETIRQIKGLDGNDLIIENKPQIGIGNVPCVGVSPHDIAAIKQECGVDFCLDIAHCYAFAAHRKMDALEALDQFMALAPTIAHICDGDQSAVIDRHLNLGKGNYPLRSIMLSLPADLQTTLETPKDFSRELADFAEECALVKKIRTNEPGNVATKKQPGSFEIVLCRAEKRHSANVLSLSNDPEVRAVSFSSDPIAEKDHVVWFDSKLEDPNCAFYIGETRGGEMAGQIRFQESHGQAEVSISVCRNMRGKGVGHQILVAGIEKLVSEKNAELVYAYARESNEPSVRLFQDAGFTETEGKTAGGHKYKRFEYRVTPPKRPSE